MKLKNLLAGTFDFLAWRTSESIAYDEVFGAPGDAALAPPYSAAAASHPPMRAGDADLYFKEVFADPAL